MYYIERRVVCIKIMDRDVSAIFGPFKNISFAILLLWAVTKTESPESKHGSVNQFHDVMFVKPSKESSRNQDGKNHTGASI